MDTVIVRGTPYKMAEDGLFYKDMMVDGVKYSVPMYLSRLRKAWRIYIKMNDQTVIRQSIVDKNMVGNTERDRIEKGLAVAIAEIKNILVDNSQNPALKYIRILEQRKFQPVDGVQVNPIFNKPSSMEARLLIDIRAVIPGQHKRIPGVCKKINIFNTNELEFNEVVRHAVLMRKYYESKVKGDDFNNCFSIGSSPDEMEDLLLKGVDMTLYKYENYLVQFENQINIAQLPLDEIMFIQTKDHIIVDRTFKSAGQIPERKAFSLSGFESNEVAERIARLYQAHLASTKPNVFNNLAH